MSSEKPFWEGKTCKEMAGLHVKATWKNGTIVTGVLDDTGDIDLGDNRSLYTSRGYDSSCDFEYMVYRVEIANHRRGSSSLVTFHLDRDDSRPEHKTVGQSASAYLSVDEAKQIMQALQQAIKEADDE